MYFRVNLKMKESRFCCCFRWIVFIEINFTVAFQLIMKTWDNRFVGKIGWWGILRNGVGRGVDTPLRTMNKNQDLESEFLFFNCMYLSKSSTKKMIIFIIFKNYKINLVFLQINDIVPFSFGIILLFSIMHTKESLSCFLFLTSRIPTK